MMRVLITGAASGLGRAIALAYAKRGAHILIADIHAERAAESVALCVNAGAAAAEFLALDITAEHDFIRTQEWLVNTWGGVDVVVNNAGVAGGGSFEGISEDDWLWMLNVNLLGVVRGCRIFTPLFKAQKSGQFINIASMAGLLNPPSMANYNVAKAGVISLSETLASELSPWNIRTLAVAPSYFQTNLGESLRTHDATLSHALSKLLSSSELNASDIAEGIVQAAERGDALYLPHAHAQAAWEHKQQNPEQYAEIMRAQALKISQRREIK